MTGSVAFPTAAVGSGAAGTVLLQLSNDYTHQWERRSPLPLGGVFVEQGKMIAVVGESGCGKTTLLNVFARLVAWDKHKITGSLAKLSMAHFRRRVGIVFQDDLLLENCSILENVLLGRRVLGDSDCSLNIASSVAVSILESTFAFKNRRIHGHPSQLSGGMRSRVGTLRAIAHSPQLVICDEPTSNLDLKNTEGVLGLLQRWLVDAPERSVVFATHNVFSAFRWADVVWYYDKDSEAFKRIGTRSLGAWNTVLASMECKYLPSQPPLRAQQATRTEPVGPPFPPLTTKPLSARFFSWLASRDSVRQHSLFSPGQSRSRATKPSWYETLPEFHPHWPSVVKVTSYGAVSVLLYLFLLIMAGSGESIKSHAVSQEADWLQRLTRIEKRDDWLASVNSSEHFDQMKRVLADQKSEMQVLPMTIHADLADTKGTLIRTIGISAEGRTFKEIVSRFGLVGRPLNDDDLFLSASLCERLFPKRKNADAEKVWIRSDYQKSVSEKSCTDGAVGVGRRFVAFNVVGCLESIPDGQALANIDVADAYTTGFASRLASYFVVEAPTEVWRDAGFEHSFRDSIVFEAGKEVGFVQTPQCTLRVEFESEAESSTSGRSQKGIALYIEDSQGRKRPFDLSFDSLQAATGKTCAPQRCAVSRGDSLVGAARSRSVGEPNYRTWLYSLDRQWTQKQIDEFEKRAMQAGLMVDMGVHERLKRIREQGVMLMKISDAAGWGAVIFAVLSFVLFQMIETRRQLRNYAVMNALGLSFLSFSRMLINKHLAFQFCALSIGLVTEIAIVPSIYEYAFGLPYLGAKFEQASELVLVAFVICSVSPLLFRSFLVGFKRNCPAKIIADIS